MAAIVTTLISIVQTLLLVTCLYAAEPAFCAQSDLSSIIKRSGVLQAGKNVQATVAGTEVIVSILEDPKTKDKDLKIDTVLLAKVISESMPAVTLVRAIFYNRFDTAQYRQVIISPAYINLFKTRKISDQELLDQLAVTAGQSRLTGTRSSSSKSSASRRDVTQLSPGIFMSERRNLLTRILNVEEAGYPTKECWRYFDLVEQAAKENNTDGLSANFQMAQMEVAVLEKQLNQVRSSRNSELDGFPKAGPEYAARSDIFLRLKRLQEKGIDVRELKATFYARLEDPIRKGVTPPGTQDIVNFLSNKISVLERSP